MLADSPRAFGTSLEDARGLDERRWRVHASSRLMPDSCWFVAVDQEGRWLGQMAGREIAGACWLLEVYLSPALRGSGAAQALLRRIEEWAAARGHAQLRLEVNERQLPARRFYEREGFVDTGASQPHDLYPEDREIEMVKTLAGSA